MEIVDNEEAGNSFAAYFAEDSASHDMDIVYSPELGLAMESMSDGMTLEKLWQVL